MSKRLAALILLSVLAIGLMIRPVQAQGASGPLAQLLTQVDDNPESRTVMWYGSLNDLEKVLGLRFSSVAEFQKLTPAQQARYLLDIGKQVYYSPFTGTEQSANWKQTFGIDPYAVDRELTVGRQPNWYDILQGKFNAGAIGQGLKNLGYNTIQVGSAQVYSIGGDNAAASGPAALASAAYNRLIVSDTQIIAAPSTNMITAGATVSKPVGNDPAYAALVTLLEGQLTVPTTQLLSAVLFDGPTLTDKVLTADPLAAAVGNTLSATQLEQFRQQLGLQKEKPLPRYDAVGFGYRRNATARYLVIGLVYSDANAANQAQTILADRLPRYGSFRQEGRLLFDPSIGWNVSVKTNPAPDNKFVVSAILQYPKQTDVSWITDVVQNRDMGFLATVH